MLTRTIRVAGQALLVLVLAFASLVAIGMSATAEPTTDPAPPPQVTTNGSPDPNADNYSPVAWNQVWDPSAVNYTPVQQGDLQTGLRQAGLVLPELFQALTPAEREQVQKAWKHQLLRRLWDKERRWQQSAFRDTSSVPEWSSADAEWAAKELGGRDYPSSSPGMKAIAQRMAMIVTGDSKPKMPDDKWQAWMPPEFKTAWDARPDKRFAWSEVTMTLTPRAEDLVMGCDTPGWITWACKATQAVAGTVAKVIEVGKDPIGWLAQKAGDGAGSLLNWVSGQGNDATTVDLSLSWWISAYQKGFAVGIGLMLLVLMWQLHLRSRGKVTGQEIMESFTLWAPAYFAGAIFGPPLAQFMIQGAARLTDSVVESMVDVSASKIAGALSRTAQDAGNGEITGGSWVALLVCLLIMISCLVIFVSLAVQAAAVYLAGAVFAIALAWIVSARQRGGSTRIPVLVLGIIFARPLLFFMLGLGLGLTNWAIIGAGSDSGTRNLAMLVMAVVVLAISAFAPFMLLKFAPIYPSGMGGATAGASSVSPRPGTAGAGTGGGSRLWDMSKRGALSTGSSAGRGVGAARSARGGGAGFGGAIAAGAGALVGGAAATAGAGAGPGASRAASRGGGSSVGHLRSHFRRGGTPTAAQQNRLERMQQAGPGRPTWAGGDGSNSLSHASTSASRRHSTGGAGTSGGGNSRLSESRGGGFLRGAARGVGLAAKTSAKVGTNAARASGSVGSGVANSARRLGEDLGDGLGSDQPW